MSKCSVFEDPSITTFTVAAVMTIGIFASYLPQHLRIINRKTSEGLSPIFLLLGSTSGCSAFLNLCLLTSIARQCCHYDSNMGIFECLNSQMGLIEVGVQFVSYTMILILALFITNHSIVQDRGQYLALCKVFYIFAVYACINTAIVIYILYWNDTYLEQFASYSGIISSILGGIQYFPQIYTTFLLKHAGSLSVKMMLIQTPGGFLWTLTLYLAPNSNWSSWLPYFTAAMLQGILLCMCLYYQSTRNEELLEEEAVEAIAEQNLASQETDPLL